ncbi:MAG: hypothetical protein HY300_16285 [Verrucomicrobia bacterium]|nr:hypothetical protein [Verrucomicrobiota bacterium]
MPDPTPAPAPAPVPKRTRSTINRAHLDELANSRLVAKAAAKSDYAAGLAAVEFDTSLVTQLNSLADQVDKSIAKLTGARAGKTAMTTQEKAAHDALIAVIAPIQTAAKRKFSGDQTDLRAAYYIGESLASDTLEEVRTAANSILARLTPGENNPAGAGPLDVLPGIKPDEEIKDLADAIAKYGDATTAQGDQQSKAAGTLEEIVTKIGTLAGLRHQVQLAADQAWPWRNDGVATIRKDFLLPVDRPLTD